MNTSFYKCCAVPMCKSTSISTTQKLFINVPKRTQTRRKWLTLARKHPSSLTTTSTSHFCEDHFDLPNDMENYMQYHLMGSVAQVRMKRGCMPTKFECQPDRKTLTPNPIERPFILKKRRKMAIEDAIKDLEERSMVTKRMELEEVSSGSSVQPTEVKQALQENKTIDKSVEKHITPKVRSKAGQIEIKLEPVTKEKYVDYDRHQNALEDLPLSDPGSSTDSCSETEHLTQEKYVDNDRHQDALEDLPLSDPSASPDSCSETVSTLKRKIKEECDLLEGQDDSNPSYVICKQEDFEDIDASVPNLSSASYSQTNTACGSATRESHFETFTEYEFQNTVDIAAMKEEPGSPLSELSIHSDADDSPEEQAIKIKLREKIEMLNVNEEILKRRREEVSILEKKHKELLADIKYLQNEYKKKHQVF